ncbi:MAG: hypothetical protein CBB80_001435 [Synechococcus sp. TMED20]|nr:MAG: hypothetical protein CBB80_001435 [Synechococcus sp. TMED20]
MPRYRCPSCCCGPAIVLHPPKKAVPICSRCRTPLERQPLVKPLPLLVLVSVGTVLVLSSFPMLFSPSPSPPAIPDQLQEKAV